MRQISITGISKAWHIKVIGTTSSDRPSANSVLGGDTLAARRSLPGTDDAVEASTIIRYLMRNLDQNNASPARANA